eukprot:1299654-Rhodomonas_salina.3
MKFRCGMLSPSRASTLRWPSTRTVDAEAHLVVCVPMRASCAMPGPDVMVRPDVQVLSPTESSQEKTFRIKIAVFDFADLPRCVVRCPVLTSRVVLPATTFKNEQVQTPMCALCDI